jgi:hypothetical protein
VSNRRYFRRFIPSFDYLEDRWVPAGNLTPIFFDGHLRLEGDDEANEIRIIPAGNGAITIEALDGDTTIGGEELPRTFNNVKGLAIALGGGDDVVEIDGLFIRKDLAINGNDGNDTITVESTFVKYRGFFFGEEGDDTINIENSHFRREINLFTGVGDDEFNFEDSSIGEESEVHGGPGEDSINAENNDWGEDTRASGFEIHNGDGGGDGDEEDPVAVNDTASVAAGGTATINVSTNDTDADGTLDLDSIVITQQPTRGTVTANANGTVTYTNTSGTSGQTDTFQYTIQDDDGNTSNTATVTVTLTDANQAPVANNDTATVGEGASVSINVIANDTDANGTIDPTTVVIFQNPTSGTATVNANGSVTYTHNGSETTSDSFQYTVRDNNGTVSNVATVNITITAGNDPPVATNDSGQTTSGGTLTINVAANDTDPEGQLDLDSIIITQQPTNGTATANADGTVTFVHNGTGTSATFQYTIQDQAGGTSNAATVTILIGTAPVANDDTATLNEGASTTINVSANDTDSDGTINPASIVITQQPTRGTVTVNANGSVAYTHNGSETTSDSFSYTIKDNQGLVSNAATVSITVTPVNDNPVATNDTLFVAPSGSATFNVSANDSDPEGQLDLTSIIITTQPTQGTVVANNDGTVTYTRSGAGTTGDSFQYTIKDQTGATSNVATVTVVVTNAPVANNDTGTVTEAGFTTINVAANDTDSDGTINPNSIVIVTQPENGLVVANANGSVTYTHSGSETTSDTFTYTIKDNTGATSNVATVTITVTPVNDAPVAVPDSGNVTSGGSTTINVASNDTDADGTINPASIAITLQPTNGTAVANADGTITYTHNGSATTSDTFQYTINDNTGATSNAATVSITVGSAVNPPPDANDDAATVDEGAPVTINLAANDTDNGTLDLTSIIITTQPTNGSVVVNGDGTVTYTHNGTETTTDTFTYTIEDTQDAVSNEATVTVTVTPVNDAPLALNDSGTVTTGGSTLIEVLNNDSDVDGTLDPATVTIVDQPANGTIQIQANGSVFYTHNGSATTSDSFTYTVKDNSGAPSNTATVNITVSAANAPPVANGDALFAATGGTGSGNLIANDFDLDGTLDPASITITVQPTQGTVTVNGDGTITYSHTGAGQFDSFQYTVKDNLGATSNAAAVSVFIHAAPVAGDDAAQVQIGQAVIINLIANDTASGGALINPASIVIVSQPAEGTVTINGDGTVTYTSNAGSQAASDTFTYTVKDSHGLTSNIATVTITLLPTGQP